MIRTDKRMRLCTVLLVLILAFIWGNSLMPGWISQAISNWVQNLLVTSPSDSAGNPVGNGLLRKAAHFSEFTALGMCLGWLFGMLQKTYIWPLGCGVLAACIDETIQAFVPERAARLLDVCIDSSGVLTGVFLLWLCHWLLRKKNA